MTSKNSKADSRFLCSAAQRRQARRCAADVRRRCCRVDGPARHALCWTAVLLASCGDRSLPARPAVSPAPQDAPARTNDRAARQRMQMVDRQLAGRDITDARVLEAMRRVPRHELVPPDQRERAYRDSPLPIGHGQTISQPYIVALMTQLVDPQPHKKALDVGTGSGYQAAVLGELVREVYSIEIVKPLADQAGRRLRRLGYENIHVRHGDGYHGWPSEAPFDIVVVAAAPDHVPEALVAQLAPGGRMVIPVGRRFQQLLLIEKSSDGAVTRRSIVPVAFVPMTGAAEKSSR